MIRNEVERLCCLNVLRRCNESKWAAPSFGTPKKNGQIRFVSDFCQLNKMDSSPFPSFDTTHGTYQEERKI
jgi:hypothetical protein